MCKFYEGAIFFATFYFSSQQCVLNKASIGFSFTKKHNKPISWMRIVEFVIVHLKSRHKRNDLLGISRQDAIKLSTWRKMQPTYRLHATELIISHWWSRIVVFLSKRNHIWRLIYYALLILKTTSRTKYRAFAKFPRQFDLLNAQFCVLQHEVDIFK